MSKISCGSCGCIHERNYECDAKRQAKAERSKRNSERIDNTYYNTSKWKKIRKQVIEEYNNLCIWSFFVKGQVIGSNCVHHIEEVLEDNGNEYEWDNLCPLNQHVHRSIVHELYKTNCKKQIQQMLKDMIKDYESGDRELSKYQEKYEKIVKDIY